MARFTRAVRSFAVLITFLALGMIVWHWILHSGHHNNATALFPRQEFGTNFLTTTSPAWSFGTISSSCHSGIGVASSAYVFGATPSPTDSPTGSPNVSRRLTFYKYGAPSSVASSSTTNTSWAISTSYLSDSVTMPLNLSMSAFGLHPSRTASISSHKSTIGSRSISESCTSTVTATYKSVFCTVTTSTTTLTTSGAISTAAIPVVLRRGTDCSTLAYSTVIKCSASGTTVTSSVTATATDYFEFCEWSKCGSADCLDLDLDKRGNVQYAPKRSNQPEPTDWATTGCYGGDAKEFMRGEVALAFSQGMAVDVSQADLTTSFAHRWGAVVESVSLEGLYGCMAVIVVSQRGVLGFHVWEVPTFKNKDKGPKDPAVYKKNAKDALEYKDPAVPGHMAGILNMRKDSPSFRSLCAGFDDIFNTDAQPEIFILAPTLTYNKDLRQVKPEDKVRYPEVEADIMPFLQKMFKDGNKPYDVPITHIKYSPNAYQLDRNYYVAEGKALIQYQPAPDNKRGRRAMYKVWTEGYVQSTKAWTALPGQVYGDPQGLQVDDQCPSASALAW